MNDTRPEFATNRPGERVADAINAHLAHLRTTWQQPPDLAIASAYFNPGGFLLLADELERTGQVRLLIGAEPAVPTRRVRSLGDGVSPARARRVALRRALDGHDRTLAEDRDLLGFSTDADTSARRLVDWLNSGKVEVRRLEDAFLHGKAFIVTSHHEGVLAGSSNFTHAGLATNLELNLGQYQPGTVAQVAAWFDDLWQRAVPYDLAGLYAARFEPHPPYVVYLRMLLERYGAELEAEARDQGVGQIHLASFQRDGLWRAARILSERHGTLIADEVGLGKTFLAGELIRQAVEQRRQRVVVIAPATLRDGPWRKFLATYQLGVECLSFDDLVGGKLRFDPREYATVVVDEAHNLRNPGTQRAAAMRALLAGTPPKDLVLLTATPVNNSLWDLYSLLYYFINNDAAFADVGIASLRDHFAEAMAQNPDDLSPEHLFDVLDAVAVRRTRPFVKRYYPGDRVQIDGQWVPITFPTPRVRKVTYELDDVLPGFFDRFAAALEGPEPGGEATPDPNVLALARYSPSRYRADEEVFPYEMQLAGLLRSGLLKRFESSAYAFACTCRTMADSHDAFLTLLDEGWVATGEALRTWVATDTDDVEEIASYLDRNSDALEAVAEYDVDALRTDVVGDRDLLRTFAAGAEKVTPDSDPKLAALVEELAKIAEEAREEGLGKQETRDKRKVLIFSYYADTVEWITAHLRTVIKGDARLGDFQERLTSISGRGGSKDEVLWGFAPRTMEAPPAHAADLYDIVVTTDVLAEGVNLQQARHIVNYDLPWNPMRLVQRHGRIDRIGSRHSEVFLRCVFPDRQLDDLLGLEERLQRKLRQAAAAVGVAEVLPGSAAEEVTFSETRDEIDRLRSEDAGLFEQGARRSALTGEEYRQELRKALEDPSLAERLRGLPWGSGSGLARPGASPGFVFCARVGDHERVQFRYVDLSDPAAPEVVGDTLACLAQATCPDEMGTLRVLDDETYSRAFGAWDVARNHIVVEWNRASDPANLVTPVPSVMHRAADLVRTSRPADMSVDEADRLVDTLQAPYPERILRDVRRTLGSDAPPDRRVRQLAALVRELGLEPPPPPRPLPEIVEDDVHLVCWLAIVREPATEPEDDTPQRVDGAG